MSKLKELTNEQPPIFTVCDMVFSNKFNPLEINDMLFNDELLKERLLSKFMMCRIGEYPKDKFGYYAYDRFVTQISHPWVMINHIIETEKTYQAHITIPSMYINAFSKLSKPVIHPVSITDAETMTGFRIAYFVLYSKEELLSSNIYNGTWYDYDKDVIK